MRSFHHWTPGYIKNRIAEIIYQKRYPDYPWLTHFANQILNSWLMKSDIGLEFGSGRSTLWFAKRIKHLISVEHDEAWCKIVQNALEHDGYKNVNYHLLPKNNDSGFNSAYVGIVDKYEKNSLDFVLVDGDYRDLCALKSLSVIRPGGILIIDNVNWFLPSNSHSPDSRTNEQGPAGETWADVHESISKWRKIWTSSGVTDTAIFFKPNLSE